MNLGWTLPKRLEYLKAIEDQGSQRKEQLKFQGKLQLFDVFRVPIDMPKYRLKNGRTIGAQRAYLTKHPESPRDLFSKDPESITAQAAQHEILRGMAGAGATNLLQYFQRHDQEQSLVLDHNGHVVNGNRRLASMRALYDDDPHSYGRFSHVDVVVLPPCSERDIYELEVGLQIAPDIKMAYEWTDRALMLRNGRKIHGYSDEELARIYEMKPKDIRELLQTLDQADAYLEAIGKPGEYALVQETEFAFKEMLRAGKNLQDETERMLFERLSYSAIETPPPSLGRLYNVIPDIKECLPTIIEELSDALPDGETLTEPAPSEYDLFFPTPHGANDGTSDLLEVIRQGEHKELVSKVISDVVQDHREKEKVKGSSAAALTHLKKASSAAKSALNSLVPEADIKAICEQLHELETTLAQLKEAVAARAES